MLTRGKVKEHEVEGFGVDLNLYGTFSNNREFNLAPFYASP